MRGLRVLRQPPSGRNPQMNRGTPEAGLNLDVTTGILCPFPHAAQAVPIVILADHESHAIVSNP